MPTTDGTITVTCCGVAVQFDCEFSYAHRPAEGLSRWAGGGVAVAPALAEVELLDLCLRGPDPDGRRRAMALAILDALSPDDAARIEMAILEQQHGD